MKGACSHRQWSDLQKLWGRVVPYIWHWRCWLSTLSIFALLWVSILLICKNSWKKQLGFMLNRWCKYQSKSHPKSGHWRAISRSLSLLTLFWTDMNFKRCFVVFRWNAICCYLCLSLWGLENCRPIRTALISIWFKAGIGFLGIFCIFSIFLGASDIL